MGANLGKKRRFRKPQAFSTSLACGSLRGRFAPLRIDATGCAA
jgi:hypothetical protein